MDFDEKRKEISKKRKPPVGTITAKVRYLQSIGLTATQIYEQLVQEQNLDQIIQHSNNIIYVLANRYGILQPLIAQDLYATHELDTWHATVFYGYWFA